MIQIYYLSICSILENLFLVNSIIVNINMCSTSVNLRVKNAHGKKLVGTIFVNFESISSFISCNYSLCNSHFTHSLHLLLLNLISFNDVMCINSLLLCHLYSTFSLICICNQFLMTYKKIYS